MCVMIGNLTIYSVKLVYAPGLRFLVLSAIFLFRGAIPVLSEQFTPEKLSPIWNFFKWHIFSLECFEMFFQIFDLNLFGHLHMVFFVVETKLCNNIFTSNINILYITRK